MIKVVVFDLDDVLVKENCLFSELFENKYKVPHEEFYDVMKSSKMLERTKKNGSNFSIFHNLLEKYKIETSEKKFFDLWLNNFKAKKDVVDLAISLKKNYKISVISDNFLERAGFFRKKVRWFRNFDYSLFSSDIGYTKKSPKMFLKLIKDLKIKPEETVFIDDDEKNVNVARSVGMNGIVFKNIDQLKKELKAIQGNVCLKKE